MAATQSYPNLSQEILAGLTIAGNIAFSPLTRGWYSKWGATEEELGRALPGDDIVPEPNILSTRAITIEAPAEAVWPWLAQMGQERGGLYTYQRLENLAKCEMENAERIVPEFQDLDVGGSVRLGGGEGHPAFEVVEILPPKALILRGDPGPGTVVSWVFYLEETGEESCRLIIRYRLVCEPTFGNFMIWRIITEPIHFVMERGTLRGVKSRVEAQG